ncbi:MAG: mxaJ protein [Methylobacteriaceae bacterium]|jgi:mxaJ protein|nr:mxaJ protein [Methylobacteriaceae bacterium]
MSSAFHKLAFVALAVCSTAAGARELRVCADPNNRPFSAEDGSGMENKIVAVIGEELGADVTYTWFAQRRGFLRNTLNAGKCDLVPGIPAKMEMLRTTLPYYRSGYVFVRKEGTPKIESLDDPALKTLRIGVQLIGNDATNTPPVHALAHRGITGNVRGFMVYGDYESPDPASAIVEAVASGDVDVAIVWGPPAGYFSERQNVKLAIEPVPPSAVEGDPPMRFDIAMGVRKSDKELAAEIDRALIGRRADIDAILAAYHVPRFDEPRIRAQK